MEIAKTGICCRGPAKSRERALNATLLGRRVRRRDFIAGAAAALAAPAACRAQPGPRDTVSLGDFGGVGDGATDNGPALAAALEAARRLGRPLLVPAGIFLVEDTHIHRGGAPFVPHQGAVIQGSGPGSALRFRRVNFPAFNGLTIRHDGLELRDLALELDNRGGSWTAAACVTAPVRSLLFSRVLFRGLGGRTGHYGVMPLNADIDGLRFERCRFESLDFGFTKATSDVSTQRNIAVIDCTAIDCTEALEFNSPGLFRGAAQAGSATVAGIADDNGNPFDTRALAPGQAVRSVYFPAGTMVASIGGESRITLSAPALRTSPAGDKARFSAGGCRDGVIRNLRVKNIAQWGVGFAHCEHWSVEAYGEDVAYELVHIEDGSSDFEIVAGGVRCNTSPGVVGSPRADNAMVHVSTGSRDIRIRLADADLRGNRGGSPNALCVQAGGAMGTTGLEVSPRAIKVGGRVLMQEGTLAVIAYDSDLRFEDLEMINVDPASRADPMMRLNGCTWSGAIGVRNPGSLVAPHPRARGRFDRVTVLPG